MFQSRTRRLTLAAGVATATVATLTLPIGLAFAGHTNTDLETSLNGRQEVGDARGVVGDKNGRGEAYVLGIDGDATTLCYGLTVDKIGTAVAAHIHQGAAGSNGPVVANPADYYVNVHTAQYPNGAIRGQLAPQH